ncbi:MAG: ATP-binding cassette domain-containing protein, partial [Ilumatobacteraceae bacterium]
MSSLTCRDLTVGYGKLAVGRDLDLEIHGGEVMALLGPNGAGKTTIMLTLAGLIPLLGGSMELDGAPLKGGSARAANKAGVVLVPDTRALFTQLTTTENLDVAASPGGPGIDTVLDYFPALRTRAKIKTGMLSGGE